MDGASKRVVVVGLWMVAKRPQLPHHLPFSLLPIFLGSQFPIPFSFCIRIVSHSNDVRAPARPDALALAVVCTLRDGSCCPSVLILSEQKSRVVRKQPISHETRGGAAWCVTCPDPDADWAVRRRGIIQHQGNKGTQDATMSKPHQG